MAKQGMKRYYPKHKKNSETPVSELSGKAKSGKVTAPPMIAGTAGKVFHTLPPMPERSVYSVFDNDLAAENLASDLDVTAADLQDLDR